MKNNGIEPFFAKKEEDEAKWEEVHETLKESFLDTVFDIHTRIKREEFIASVSKKANYIFKPKEIRKRIKAAMKGETL